MSQLKRLRSKPVIGRILNPLGLGARIMELRGHEVQVQSGRGFNVHFKNLQTAPSVRKGLLGSSLTVKTSNSQLQTLKGARFKEALAFAEVVKTAWVAYNFDQLEAERTSIDVVLKALADLADPTRYPAACYLSPVLEQAKRLDEDLLSRLPMDAVSEEVGSQIMRIQSFVRSAGNMRDVAIQRFEKLQMSSWEGFFDNFESNPLTPTQRTSIIADEDATLVLAGAGSGKTSVITAKAGYLLKSGIRRPEEILLLAYAKDVANEMSERIEERCGEAPKAQTFHSLAYDIIGMVEGSKPALASHAADRKAFLALIKDILIELTKTEMEVSRAVVNWFSHYRVDAKSEWDFKKKHDYYTYIEKLDLRTLQGEKVKSFEELMIANWLYENGIEYEYEPNYEHKVSEGGYRDYCPDFRLVKSGTYIEHFGVRRRMVNDGTTELLTTAPFVDRDKYLESMEWKRSVHERHGTKLIETYSYERQEGRLLKALAKKILPFEEVNPRLPETLFDRVVKLGQVDGFAEFVGAFLRHYKGGGYRMSECETTAARLNLGKRAKAFLSIFGPVYLEYQSRLTGRIDFEDMILRACDYAENGQFSSPFKHILVDEFQDISQSRGRLVKALKAQHADGRIFAVGDDWQSIYRFAGSDISLMRRFGDEFGGEFDGATGVHRIVDLGQTFRSVDQIAEAATKFILENPAQLKKTVIPAGVAPSPALRVVETYKHDADSKLMNTLRAIPEKDESKEKTSVLILGRYRHLQPANLWRYKNECPHLDISFKTIHASKGLQADHVIVLGLYRGRTGFPSEIVDDPLLGLVLPEAEPFENAEERRVMYVAMTRARHTVTLLSSASRRSAFVEEILGDSAYGVVGTIDRLNQANVCGECGGQLLALPTKDGRMLYRCEHKDLCGFLINACRSCGIGLPEKADKNGLMKCMCGAEYAACPKCENGWLVQRDGPYGPFLGCVSFPRCKGKRKID